MKQYLITYILHGVQYAYYSNSVENVSFPEESDSVIYDLVNHMMLVNSLGWVSINKH